jgi:hypothetical protein
VIDKGKVFKLLQNRLPKTVTEKEINQTSEELIQLLDETHHKNHSLLREEGWEEMEVKVEQLGPSVSIQCKDICTLGDTIHRGDEIRVFRRKKEES